MKILSIETSCDETAISIIEAKGGFRKPQFKIVADTLISQIDIHKKYGGVFPSLAKREHIKNLLPILEKTLQKSKLLKKNNSLRLNLGEGVSKILERGPELAVNLINFLDKYKIPKIDAIAVTQGPGLAPALWTGINFAKALSLLWNKPFIPVNHMEGHLFASLLDPKTPKIQFPALGLLISGGHTELVLAKEIGKYKIIGQTRDDAVGEAYDKVARMLNLPYPGGPQISVLAEICAEHRRTNAEKRRNKYKFPRPMINSDDFDFSFSGLKTAVLYTVKNIKKLTPKIKQEISYEFENAVVDVLLNKTQKAIKKYKIKTLILGGGVTANKKIRKIFSKLEDKDLTVLIPETKHSTDNAIMIGIAGYFRFLNGKTLDPKKTNRIKADGNMQLK